MMTRSTPSRTRAQVIDLFEFSTAKKPERAVLSERTTLRHRIKEVIYGRRPAVRLYSSRLQSDLWLVNEGLVDPSAEIFDGKAITMQVLAEILLEQEKSLQILRNIVHKGTTGEKR